jgi:hypothetical protein
MTESINLFQKKLCINCKKVFLLKSCVLQNGKCCTGLIYYLLGHWYTINRALRSLSLAVTVHVYLFTVQHRLCNYSTVKNINKNPVMVLTLSSHSMKTFLKHFFLSEKVFRRDNWSVPSPKFAFCKPSPQMQTDIKRQIFKETDSPDVVSHRYSSLF